MFDKLKELDYVLGSGMAMGMILQYVFNTKQGLRPIIIIILSTVFLAFSVLWPLMDYFAIEADSPLRIVVISLTALMSEVLLVILMQVLPAGLSSKLKGYLGVKDE